jgi:uncharacterized tellurite resistance protein B-like protein
MSNFNQQLVALTMATLRADGKTTAAEIEVIKRVSADLECPAEETDKLLLKENEKQSKCADIQAYIAEEAKNVANGEDKQLIMEACVQVALADKKLTTNEVNVLLMVCQALQCDLAALICNIAIVAQNDRNIKIEGSDTDFSEDILEEE